MSGNCIAEPVTLADWQKILEDLGFEHKYYDYLDCELLKINVVSIRELLMNY